MAGGNATQQHPAISARFGKLYCLDTTRFKGNPRWNPVCYSNGGRQNMLWYAWVFLVVAIIAAIFGFGGIAAASVGIAKILFFVFIVLFIISLLFGRRTTL